MERLERLSLLLEMVMERGSVRVDDLVEELGVSPATVRRDLDHLASQQLLQRNRGGAVPNPSSANLPFRYKKVDDTDPLLRIAQAAAAMVEPGTVVGLNGGRTTTEVARALAGSQELIDAEDATGQLVVVTNAVNIANELAIRKHIRLVLTGGVVRALSYELTGPLASRVLEDVVIDTLFLGVNAINPDGCFTHHDGEAEINALLVGRSHRVVVVAASSKLESRSFVRICKLNAIDVLLTDTDAKPKLVRALETAGVKVVLV